MNSKLLAQMALSGMLVISLAACQKSDDNKDDGAASPTNAEKTTDVPENQGRLNAEAILAEIGLKFKDVPAGQAVVVDESDVNKDAEIVQEREVSKVAWDTAAYRSFLVELRAKGQARPDLKMQVDRFIKYVAAMEEYLFEMEKSIETSGQEMSEAQTLEHKASVDRMNLAKDRLKKLNKRLEFQMKNGAPADKGADVPLEEPKEGEATPAPAPAPAPQEQPEAPKAA